MLLGASTHSSSPWSSSRLSPVESYRKLMMTDAVRRRAAETRALDFDAFPKPKIKLVDQTNLMMISLRGLSKGGAEDNANAFLDAFNTELTVLRQDYISRRETANRGAIQGYKDAVTAAQKAILGASAPMKPKPNGCRARCLVWSDHLGQTPRVRRSRSSCALTRCSRQCWMTLDC